MAQSNSTYIKRLEIEDKIQKGELISIKDSKISKKSKVSKPMHDERIKPANISDAKSYIGLAIFLFIFTFLIANILHDLGYYSLLMVYLSNQDLIAAVLTRWGGPNDIWKDLYFQETDDFHAWISVSIINYTALLGLTYIVAREVYQHNDLHKGWSMAVLMILMTYLLPSPFIKYIMDGVYNMFPTHHSLAVLAGFITVLAIILGESYVLENHRSLLMKISKLFINLGNIV